MDGHDSPSETLPDLWGYPITTTSAACIETLNDYYLQVLSYGRCRSVILAAATADPDCVIASVLAAHFLASKDRAKSSALFAAAADNLGKATEYEKAVFGTVSCLMGEGEKDEDLAIEKHAELLKRFPKDLLSLKRAQILGFYMGRPDLSLTLVEQALLYNEDEKYIHGMLAFPLLELGKMAEAERAAKKALDIEPCDFWAQHNLCHVYQYECRFREAVDFMEVCSPSWVSCSSFMYTHNWWHVAVCYLEGNSSLDKVLEIYDQHIWKEQQRNGAEPVEVYVNALGLLLRLYVRGLIGATDERLISLSNIFKENRMWHMEWFLDILALWALATTKETNKAEDLLKSMKSRYVSMSRKKQLKMKRAIVLAEATYEYCKGNYKQVFNLLSPSFDATNLKMIGASDEQLDVFNDVWYTVLLNTGKLTEAIKEISEALNKRKGTPFLWRLLEKAYNGRSDAQVAAEKARALEGSYFKLMV